MTELEPYGRELATVPAPRPASPLLGRLGWAVGGIAIGLGIAFGPKLFTPPQHKKVAVQQALPSVASLPVAAPPVASSPVPQATPLKDSKKPEVEPDAKKPGDGKIAPMNPFASGMPTPIKGNILPGPLPSVKGSGVSPDASTDDASSARLVVLTLSVSDFERGERDVLGVLSKMGGSGHDFTVARSGEGSDTRGIVGVLPLGKLNDFLAVIDKAGSIVKQQTYSESATERQNLLNEEAKAVIGALETKKRLYQETYLDSSPAVKDLDAQISAARKTLGEFRVPRDISRAAVKVTIR